MPIHSKIVSKSCQLSKFMLYFPLLRKNQTCGTIQFYCVLTMAFKILNPHYKHFLPKSYFEHLKWCITRSELEPR